MKTITYFLITLLFVFNLTAQDKGFVHTATIANIFLNTTEIDHPDLNGDPNAHMLFSQRGGGADNDNPVGIYYFTETAKWRIFNENGSLMPDGAKFNIYIADDSEVTTHITDAANTTDSHTEIEGFLSNDFLFYSNYYNPNNVGNPYMYGSDFLNDKMRLYVETLEDIPLGAAFKIMKGLNTSATMGIEISGPENIYGNAMELDHPALNDSPDAVFLYTHYYVIGGNNNYLPYITRTVYHPPTNRWRIYAYGASGFPENIFMSFIIPDEILGVEDQTIDVSKISIYPNPVVDKVNFSSKAEIKTVEIYDITGKLVAWAKDVGTTVTLDLSDLYPGLYLSKVKTDEGMQSQKLIKR